MLICAAGDIHGAMERLTTTCSRSKRLSARALIGCCTSGTSGSGLIPKRSTVAHVITMAPETFRSGWRLGGRCRAELYSSRVTTRTCVA